MKVFVWLLILAVFCGGGAYWYLNSQQGAVEEPQIVAKKNIHRTAHGSGVLEGNGAAIPLRFGFGGMLDDVDAKEGQSVKNRDILAKLNTSQIDSDIKLASIALKEAEAKRDMLLARKSADLLAKSEAELQHEKNIVNEIEARLRALKSPQQAADIKERMDEAGRTAERCQRALALAEAELTQLNSHPTQLELEAAAARLEAAKLRSETAKQTGANQEAADVERRYALAEYDKIKRGPIQADLDAATTRVKLAQAELERAEAEKKRIEKPAALPSLPKAEIEATEKILDEAKAREAVKREAYDKLRKDAESAEMRVADAEVERTKEILALLNLKKQGYELRAPFDSLVTKRLAEPGMLLQPIETVLVVIDFARKRIRAEFDVTVLPALVKNDLKAAVKSRAFGKDELMARVIDVGKVGTRRLLQDDPSQPKGGEVVEVLLEIDPPADQSKKDIFALLRPGLRVEVDIVLESRADALCVPKSYVATEDLANGISKRYVWKVENSVAKEKYSKPIKVEVKCGLRDEYYIEILEGLHLDDLVVKPKSSK